MVFAGVTNAFVVRQIFRILPCRALFFRRFQYRMHIKICGIKRAKDALLAAELGADAIGFLVGQRHKSPDFISAQTAGKIAALLPHSVNPVLVSHACEVDELASYLRESGIRTVQLHGELTPGDIADLRKAIPGLKAFKSVHVISSDSIQYPERFRNVVDGFVLDTINLATGQIGGTGLTHDWSISRQIVQRYADRSILLAGGLNSGNVAAAIEAVQPFGVDVNSGTKGEDGYKDAEKVAEFIQRAKGCRATVELSESCRTS